MLTPNSKVRVCLMLIANLSPLMRKLLLPHKSPDDGDPECEIAIIPLDDLRVAVEQGQVTCEFALLHCPSKHIRYILGGTHRD